MAENDNEPESTEEGAASSDASDSAVLSAAGLPVVEGGEGATASDASPAQLGVTRYVHGAFLGVGVAAAYVAGKSLEALWNSLASVPAVTKVVPVLLRYREDERPAFTMTLGLLIGIVFGIWLFRNVSVRRWADDVAGELAKVHWPNRELVQNGTLVVVITGLFATVYVGLLDRLWIFVTTLVYGA
jgi:preprotein translocase subunit SecE